jgi:hypothetical protein
MDETQRLWQASQAIADAIGRKDADALARWLAPGFLHRTPGQPPQAAAGFLEAIRRIPLEIVFLRLESVEVDVVDGGAVVTGIQHAQVRMDDAVVDDRRPFVDWFVQRDGEWRLRLAVEISAAPADAPAG